MFVLDRAGLRAKTLALDEVGAAAEALVRGG